MFKRYPPQQERRKYIRLNSVFPVQFRILSLDGKRFLSDWLQGFTNNIAKGGICLTVNNLNPELAQILKDQQGKMSLEIEMSMTRSPVAALAKVSWVEDVVSEANRYLIGLKYEEIDNSRNNKIVRYTWTRKLFVPFVLSVIMLLGLGFALNSFISV